MNSQRARDRKAELGEHALREGAVVLEPVAEGAAADHLEAVAAKRVLQRAALRRRRSRTGSMPSSPAARIQSSSPRQSGVRATKPASVPSASGSVADDPDLVALLDEAQIERAEVAIVADAEEAHGPLYRAGSQKTRG